MLSIYPVSPVRKNEDTKGMNITLETCSCLNRMLNSFGTDINKGKTAEQLTPKAIGPNMATKKCMFNQ